MENTVKIRVSGLTRKHFDQYPVWTWVEDSDEEDLVCPILETDPLPTDLGDLFIRADFWTPTGLHLIGDVGLAIGDDVYVIKFEASGKGFIFNVRLKDLAEESLAELRKTLGDENAQIFPLRYETKFRFADGELIAGVFDPFQ
jgi:hypothetical protein